jgi:hypothetical protein
MGWARIALCSIGLCVLAAVYAAGSVECHIGAYLLSDGSIVDIAPSDGDAFLRWRRFDGTTGALHKTVTGVWMRVQVTALEPRRRLYTGLAVH